MKSALNLKSPYVVIEGISTNNFEFIDADKSKLKTALYSGSLSKEYGVLDLINAFRRLPNEDYRLIICGSGDIESEIKEICKEDKRIEFMGLLKRKEVLKLQKSSTVLVNPRANNFSFTKFSFPSKIMEYMSSGTPVLAYKLDGMPDEYLNYMYIIPEHENGLYLALKEVLSKNDNELIEIGLKAKEFMLLHKNSKVQTKKILTMLDEL